MRTCGATARRFRSSKTPRQSQSELSAHQMPLRRHLRLQNSLARLIPCELSAHQMCMRRRFRLQDLLGRLMPSELSSHQMAIRSHPGVSRTQLILIHFGIFGPTGCFPLQDPFKHYGFRSHQRCSPARHAPLLVPLSTSACCASRFVFLVYEGEAVDAVTPAGLPQEPIPYEEVKSIYATSSTVLSGSPSNARCVDAQRRGSCPHEVLWVRLQSPDTRRYGVPFLRGGEFVHVPAVRSTL